MIDADDGWAVGSGGTIIQWTGTEWIPEFPMFRLMTLLMGVTLVVVILKMTLKNIETMLKLNPSYNYIAIHLPFLLSIQDLT